MHFSKCGAKVLHIFETSKCFLEKVSKKCIFRVLIHPIAVIFVGKLAQNAQFAVFAKKAY